MSHELIRFSAGHALYATKRQQSRKDLHGRISSAQASTRGYAFASGEGYGRRMITGGEAMVQVCFMLYLYRGSFYKMFHLKN